MHHAYSSFVLSLLVAIMPGCAHTRPVAVEHGDGEAAASLPPPDGAKYPNLLRSWEAIRSAREHVRKAVAAQPATASLGGHAVQAVQALNAAEREIDQAVRFADSHRTAGPAGVASAKPPLTAIPDDVKYPNLGEARLQIEWAVRHVEDAMQVHAPIGSLGGHGELAIEHLRHALGEVSQSERWADAHS